MSFKDFLASQKSNKAPTQLLYHDVMSFKDFLASQKSNKAPSQPLWLTSVEGAAPRVEPPPAPPPPPPPSEAS